MKIYCKYYTMNTPYEINGFLVKTYSGSSWKEIIRDSNNVIYGIVECDNSVSSKIIQDLEVQFKVVNMTLPIFVGETYGVYQSLPLPSDVTVIRIPFEEVLEKNNIDITGLTLIDCVKEAKINTIKEIPKKEFGSINDVTIDVFRFIMLSSVYYPELTEEEKVVVDAQIEIFKKVYSKTQCIGSTDKLMNLMKDILFPYYLTKMQIDATTDIDAISSIPYHDDLTEEEMTGFLANL